MALLQKEIIQKARNIDFKEFLEQEGFCFRKETYNYYRCIQHSSLVLNKKGNIYWYNWYSRNEKGDIIAFVQNNITNGNFRKAVEYITTNYVRSYYKMDNVDNKIKDTVVNSNIEILRNENMKRLFSYLIKTRGIDSEIVSQLVGKGLILEDKNHNIVFKAIDKAGNTVGGEVRGTCTYKVFRGIVKNSNKDYGFAIPVGDKVTKLIVFEASIDLISYFQMYKDILKETVLLSTGGCTKTNKIDTYLNLYKTINEIIVCTDNDIAGDNAFNAIKSMYKNLKVMDGRKVLKDNGVNDFNEFLKHWKTKND